MSDHNAHGLPGADYSSVPFFIRRMDTEGYIKAAELPPLTDAQMAAVRRIYDEKLRDLIHPQW